MLKKTYEVHNTKTKKYVLVEAMYPKKAVESVCGRPVTKIYSMKNALWVAFERGTQSAKFKEYIGHYGPVSYYR